MSKSLQERFQAGRKAEQRAGRRLNATPMPVSGALTGAKGDLAQAHCLIESKATQADSLRLDRGWLTKINAEAREKGLEPALLLQFVTQNGQPRQNPWVAIPEQFYLELLEAWLGVSVETE